MEKYKRITNIFEFSKYCDNVNCKEFCKDCYFSNVYNKLSKFEDDLEKGELIRLPCKIGDKIYYIDYFHIKGACKYKIVEHTIIGFFYKRNIFIISVENDEDVCEKEFAMYIKKDGTFELGEMDKDWWFFDEAEAEAKLKELQNENS